jgi:glycosyltransferase involved in cell wall biosynthesis
MGKKVALWSNHYYGTWRRDVVGKFCDKIFYTSKFSYTANKNKFPQGIQMPVGVDISNFKNSQATNRVHKSILFLARLDPSKKPDMLLHALKNLKDKKIPFTATFVGGANKDKFAEYEKDIHKLSDTLGLSDLVKFIGPVESFKTPEFYLSHEIYVNVARSGMLDKAIFESVVGGCLPLATSIDFNDMISSVVSDECKVEEESVDSLTNRLEKALCMDENLLKKKVNSIQETILQKHSLETLAKRLGQEI